MTTKPVYTNKAAMLLPQQIFTPMSQGKLNKGIIFGFIHDLLIWYLIPHIKSIL